MKNLMKIVCAVILMVNMMACGSVKQVQMMDCSTMEIVQINEQIMFDYNKYNINEDQMELLDEIAITMIDNPKLILVINGYASEEGAFDYNMNLSQMRADAVKSALMLRNVPTDNIKESIGQGETTSFGDVLKDNRRGMILSID